MQPEETNDKEYLLRCLARYLLKWQLGKRRAFIDRWEKSKGQDSVGILKNMLTEEHKKQQQAKIDARREIKECLKQKNKE